MSDLILRGTGTAQKRDEILGPVVDIYPERANLFRLSLNQRPTELYSIQTKAFGKTLEEVFFDRRKGSKPIEPTIGNMKRALQRTIVSDQEAVGYKISKRSLAAVNTDTNYG